VLVRLGQELQRRQSPAQVSLLLPLLLAGLMARFPPPP